MRKIDDLYILSNGKVASINKKDGTIVWEIKLKSYVSTSLSYAIGQITVEGSKLYIGISGMLICLQSTDGSLVWVNELKGWGYGFVSMANVNNDAAAASMAAANAAAIAATT